MPEIKSNEVVLSDSEIAAEMDRYIEALKKCDKPYWHLRRLELQARDALREAVGCDVAFRKMPAEGV